MSWSQPAGKGIIDYVQTRIDRDVELAQAKITFAVSMCYAPKDKNGQPTRPAISKGGREVFWKLKIYDQHDRSTIKAPDVAIQLNGDHWNSLSDRMQSAILATAVRAIIVQRDKNGNIKCDDCGRPELKQKPASIHIEGYVETMEEFGDDAQETRQLLGAVELLRQFVPEPDLVPANLFAEEEKESVA